MIYAVTSKKGGCGRSTVALVLSILAQSQIKGKIVLSDLSYGNDLMSILKLEDTYPSIDNLISAMSLQIEMDFKRNLIESHNFYLLPGTKVNQTRYLEKRYSDIVNIVKEMETMFNAVILDIDYSLYEDLVDSGLEITPFYVLDQNMLNVEKYQEEIRKQMFDGFYIINRYNPEIFPRLDLFEKNFKKGSIVCINEDENLVSILNRKKIALSVIKSSPIYSGIAKLSAIVANNITIVDSPFVVKSHKGFFSSLFNLRSTTVEEVNSLAGLVKEKPRAVIDEDVPRKKKKKIKKSKMRGGELNG